MSAPKLITLLGLLGKEEASYGAGGSLSTSTDGLLLAEPLDVAMSYAYEGQRAAGPGTGGNMRRTTPKGRIATFKPIIHGRGAGAAYSASVLPRDLDVFLRMAGRKRTIDTTPGAENVVYDASSLKTDWRSGVFAGYTDEELVSLFGAYCAASYEIVPGDDDACWKWMFDVKAMVSVVPTDAAVPAITYQSPTTVLPPVAENMIVNIGSFQLPVIRKLTWSDGRSVAGPRRNIVAAGGIAGFGLSIKRKEVFTIELERTALVGSPYHTSAGLNPYEMKERGTVFALQVQLGATGAYNVLQHIANTCQIVEVSPERDDPSALWKLTIEAQASSPTADDDSTIAFLK